MGYTAGTINYTRADSARVITLKPVTAALAVQLYVGGVLVEGRLTSAGLIFIVSRKVLTPAEWPYFLAVDAADVAEDFWSDAFAGLADADPYLHVVTPTRPGYFRDELWRVYLDDVVAYERLIWPRPDSDSSRQGGRGTNRGHRRGFEDYGSGRGNWRGLQRGYEPIQLTARLGPLEPATYNVKVYTVDTTGNESIVQEDDVPHNTYPAVAADLTIDAFDEPTQTVTLSLTASADV